MQCLVCNKELRGKQTKFCSIKCKAKGLFNQYKNSQYQKKRGIEKKNFLIEKKGGSCQVCGYNKCIRALTFHHRNPDEKLYTLDMSSLCHRSWKSILKEAEKCDLLCMNCHMELHHNELENEYALSCGPSDESSNLV
jgi:hypothetical protein